MPTVSRDISGTVTFVTGGGSGIGAAVCCALAEAELSVAIVDMNPQAAAQSLARMPTGRRHSCAVTADVSQAGDAARAVAVASAELGEPDYLINCAGIYPRSAVAEMDEAEWDRVINTNLKSVFLMSRAVVPLMAARGGGRILSITSGLGQTGMATGAHYAASKAGITAFSRSLAQEVAPQRISVNCIAPGLTDTPMMRGANDPGYIESVAARQFGGRLGQPEEVANVVLFLLSEDAALISGQLITLR